MPRPTRQKPYEKIDKTTKGTEIGNQDKLWITTLMVIIAMYMEAAREEKTKPMEKQKDEEKTAATSMLV